MFTVSAKSIYGLCAMLQLGHNFNKGPIQIRDISQTHDIPQHYLEQLLVMLKKTGLVESFRGALGGYSLARQPSQIKVLDILESLDGKVEVVPEHKKENAAAFFWNDLQTFIEEKIDITLEDLLLQHQEFQNKINYTI